MKKRHSALALAALFAIGFAASTYLVPSDASYVRGAAVADSALAVAHTASSTPSLPPPIAHLRTPNDVRAIYMSQCVAGTPSFRDSLVKFIDDTELNAVVIDIKDATGGIAFPSDDPALAPFVSKNCGAEDMADFVSSLHEKNIYVIGRITVFQDPLYVKAHPELAVKTKAGGIWHNYGGLPFIDVGAKPFWDYIVQLATVSYRDVGFDELNFDYVRFPSDGPLSDADFTFDKGKSKPEALEEFFKYLHEKLEPLRSTGSGQVGVVTSADLFGLAAVNHDDLGIGQVLERAMPYFDYVCPMVYPSHFAKGFDGYTNVNDHPYEIVRDSMRDAVKRAEATSTSIASLAYSRIGTSTPALYEKPAYPATKIRPWLQSFDYPVVYTREMVAAQIKGNEEAGLNSYLFWDPANKYVSLRKMLAN